MQARVRFGVPRARLSAFFFPRVRTPCGHGAQVIVEGREEQSDGGEKNKDPKRNQHQQTPQARRPNLHHPVVFPLHWVKRVKQKLMAIKGLNSRKTRTTAQVCGQGKSSRGFKRTVSRILVTSSHTTVRQNKVTLQVGCLAMLKRR